MRHVRYRPIAAVLMAGAVLVGGLLAWNGSARADAAQEELFPLDYHPIMPMLPRETTQRGNGAHDDEALPQPVAFPHQRHIEVAGLQCEYCHSAARNSIHAGVPEVSVCMGCHQHVKKDSPEIQLITAYYKRGEVIPWNKVHDLPDFVYFSHMRHVRAGVDCTECHGQVQSMAGVRVPPKDPHAAEAGHGEAAAPATPPTLPADVTIEQAVEILGPVEDTMIREATLQMGWCLDCHGSHPSIDKNYGDKADLRRAELKDCWTCHK